jgi:predicted HicB family RNase H-like nuclease
METRDNFETKITENDFAQRFSEIFLIAAENKDYNTDEAAGLLAEFLMQKPDINKLLGFFNKLINQIETPNNRYIVFEMFIIPMLKKVPGKIMGKTGISGSEEVTGEVPENEMINQLSDKYLEEAASFNDNFYLTDDLNPQKASRKKKLDEILDKLLELIAENCVKKGVCEPEIPPYDKGKNGLNFSHAAEFTSRIALINKIVSRL